MRLPLATVALHLLAHGGIALCVMDLLRTRRGRREDRFLCTVLIGNGLPVLAMSFVAAALAPARPGTLLPADATPLGCRWRPGITGDAGEARFA